MAVGSRSLNAEQVRSLLQASDQTSTTQALIGENASLTAARLESVRRYSEALIKPLQPEDLCLQGMPEASPPKWHLAHTTWFFETFLLQPHLKDHTACDPRWSILFNSYYDAVGERHPRPERGLLSRPSINEILAWRQRVDAGLTELLNIADPQVLQLAELGLHHEQQHQELLLMDLLDAFSRQPLEPTYQPDADWQIDGHSASATWLTCPGGLMDIGHQNDGFHFDNEAPRHRLWLDPFELSDTLVSNEDYRAFMRDGGYERPELWMSEGWSERQRCGWSAPRYWLGEGSAHTWHNEFTLAGRQPLNPKAPVRHLSWFEADAFARWQNARLPTEGEWEVAIEHYGNKLRHAHGCLWQWTASPYRPYPGFHPAAGAIGEYNGKFMSSQFVLRGSSWLTPNGHCRNTYRNFFPPASRWMAAGLRLAR